MADNKKKQTPVTLEEIRDLLTEYRNETKVQLEQLIYRLESIYVTRRVPVKGAKKPVVKKPAGVKGKANDKDFPTHFSNTMYWWTAMYSVQDPIIKKCYTAEEVKIAEESIAGIKDKPEGYNTTKAVGLALWKGFSKSKKSGELKTMFDNWKKANAKLLAKDVENETHTDDEPDVKKKGKDEDEEEDEEEEDE